MVPDGHGESLAVEYGSCSPVISETADTVGVLLPSASTGREG